MSPKHFAFVFASLTASALAGDQYLVYFGTYTNAKSGSKSIYFSRFDASTRIAHDSRGGRRDGQPELPGDPSFQEVSFLRG
ncbi:MAG: hypothetical protein H7A55_08185 [Verrucomicrobiaceae bacterium]|nr:hypothetical protein [Verrucomicrobiaceae bacterium]